MEWREQSYVSCDEAFSEAQRWIEAVTKKKFGSNNFRSELENGVLLCELINRIKPGVVRRVNRLPTPIAGLDNLNVFLRACGKLGLKEAQLFHPGDLQDLSTRVTVKHEETCRRLKNVLITIYWLGRRAQSDHFYDGPYLNFKAFEGLLGTALYKALQDTSSQKGGSIRDSGFGDRWYSEREELNHLRAGGGGGGGRHRRDDSSDSLDSLGSRPHSVSSETTVKGSSEGCCSDAEVEFVFRMADKDSKAYRRSLVLTPKTTAQFNQFLPTKDKQPSYVPAPLRKKRAERNEESRRSWASSGYAEDEGTLTSNRETKLSSECQAYSRVSCSALPAAHLQSVYDYESGSDSDTERPDPDLVLDDLASRRFHSPSPATPTNFAVPVSPLTGCESGPWPKVTVTSSVAPEPNVSYLRQQETQESTNGSKSTSDIDSNPSVTRLQRYEELQKYREQIKDSDDKWQDDLSKWKSRRRSVNSDIVKKKEEREQIEQITTTSSRRSKTFREMQEERENNRSRFSSIDILKDDDVFERPAISLRSRTLPTRSYTIDTPYSSGTSASHPKEEEPPSASLATGRASSPLTTHSIDRVDGPAGRKSPTSITSNSSTNSYQSSVAAPSQKSPVLLRSRSTKTEENTSVVSSTSSLQRLPQPSRPLSGTSFFGSQFKQPQLNTMQPNPPAVSRVSASLPRSYQKMDSARLTSVVTPRPFGAQASRISSLSRTNPMDNSQKPINGEVSASKKSLVPSRYHQFMTPEDEEQSSSAHSSEDEEEQSEKEERSTSSVQVVSSTQNISPVAPQVKREAPVIPAAAKESSQESRSEMRISLNQKPNSSRDFGFQATWDSTGARVTSVQPGSPAQMCQLQPGDEVLTVNGHKVAELSYTEWKSQLEEALQEGSLVMDISREGQNMWDRNQPSLPFRSHKTLNLTSMDHPILLGSTETNPIKPSLDFTSRVPSASLQTPNILAHQVIDVASNGVNGGFREESVTMRNKESEPISLKNLKRRSEFFEKVGPESTMPEIPVPPITPSSRWSWDPEEERRRQEKWQKEQERLLQEKYKRDHEKLQEEWERAQQEIAQHTPSSLEANDQTVSLRSAESPFSQPTSLLWEAEEDRERKEEQERQRQAEEKRKREEEERELQRLREERARRERQEEEERKRREEEELQWQRKREDEERKRREEEELQLQRKREEERNRREEELRWQKKREEEEEKRRREEEELRWQRKKEEEEERRRQEAEQQRRERERVMEQQQWTKSKSSPQLDEVDTSQSKGMYVQTGSMAYCLLEEQLRRVHDRLALSERAASELELQQRRHILSVMRYREPERVTGSGLGERKGSQSVSQAELDRQQILNEMKKKAPLLTDSSWIRQRSASSASNKDSDIPPMRRGESLDNLNNSWRSSWTPRGNSHVQNYARPHSALSGRTSFFGGGSGPQRPASTLPSSYSMSSMRGGAGTPTSAWSASSPSPTTSPEPWDGHQQRNRSVSGKKICTFCENPLGKGAAMIIESLGLCYHLSCFKCYDCKSDLGGSEAGAEVRIRNKQLYCNNCYMGFKSSQPTSM
ncbi:LIM domain only protein 7 isoform X4 [Gouania willdenowi]|uniref:LIM domain only protein 7 isoform X4 n=1 Tax=Gouania willdenowi TaxID=441366 RepID=UPI001054B187|nr:LIM domain only protein 7 isoform X4 [Gouania willdenowi]